jgi:hypothetical protein
MTHRETGCKPEQTASHFIVTIFEAARRTSADARHPTNSSHRTCPTISRPRATRTIRSLRSVRLLSPRPPFWQERRRDHAQVWRHANFAWSAERISYHSRRIPGPLAVGRGLAVGIRRDMDDLIHLYQRGTPPFRSLSALSAAEALDRMRALYVEGAVFWERFKEPEGYWQARKQVEAWVRRDFIAKGGRPRSEYPIYMVWGRSKWMETAIDPVTRATTAEIRVPLSDFQEDTVSFTYPDSMVSYILDQHRDPAYYLPGYHGKVFTLAEIRAIVEANGLPGYRWGTELPSHLANYIEAQVWDHEPLRAYVSG